MPTISVLIADDHALVRAGIRALVESLPDATVVGEATDGREAIELLRHIQPDLVLMDIAMPGLNGLEATARISKDFPLVKVIILSMYEGEDYVNEAIKAGAIGYVVKGDASVVLEDAIKKVARGEKYFSPLASRHITKGKTSRKSAERELVQSLTPRQREILQLIAERQSTKEIAHILNISVKTVETHRSQLMARLGIHDVPGLVRLAIRARLVLLEE